MYVVHNDIRYLSTVSNSVEDLLFILRVYWVENFYQLTEEEKELLCNYMWAVREVCGNNKGYRPRIKPEKIFNIFKDL